MSYQGGYAPVVTASRWKKVGTAALPEARPVTIEQLISGTEDGQRIEVSGVIRAMSANGSKLAVELASGGYRIRAYTPIAFNTNIQAQVGATVRVKGTAAASFNKALRHFITVGIYVPLPADFIIEKPVMIDPFQEPVIPLDGIAQYRKDRSFNDRVHVKGVFTYQKKAKDCFFRMPRADCKSKAAKTCLSPGEVIEAVGFPGVENYLPVLEDAVFKNHPSRGPT